MKDLVCALISSELQDEKYQTVSIFPGPPSVMPPPVPPTSDEELSKTIPISFVKMLETTSRNLGEPQAVTTVIVS